MKVTELFRQGEFVVTAEVGPPKGCHLEGVVEEAKEYLETKKKYLREIGV